MANQKAKYLWRKLNRLGRDRAGPAEAPFRFHNAGSLAYVGGWHAVYDRTRAETARGKEAGRFAWLLWRSAYFTMTLSVKNKCVAPFFLVYFGGRWADGRVCACVRLLGSWCRRIGECACGWVGFCVDDVVG